MSGKRRLRPGTGSLLGMMVLNALVSVGVLVLIYALFGLNGLFAHRLAAQVGDAAKWNTLWPLLPGAAISYSLLWFWQIIVGRSRGVNWGSACYNGIAIAFANVLLGGLLNGLVHGNPLIGMLLGFLMLLMIPANWAGMAAFGLIMGLLNARLAAVWIERYYPRP